MSLLAVSIFPLRSKNTAVEQQPTNRDLDLLVSHCCGSNESMYSFYTNNAIGLPASKIGCLE